MRSIMSSRVVDKRDGCRGLGAVVLLLLLIVPQQSLAKEPPAPAASPTSQPTRGERLDALERQLDALRAKVSSQNAEIERLAAAGSDDEADKLAALQGGSGPRPLQIYGFFDVMAHRLFIKEGTFFEGLLNDTASFLINRLNVYMSKQLSESFSALIELRFTFSPLGNVTAYGVPAFDLPYERQDTTILDPYSGSEYRLGGVMIERVYGTYRPHDAFGVRAGHFLTPFGIWNEDHGSPVLVTIRQPFVILSQPVPLAQTGLQVFGRFFPSSDTTFDYAVTLSNGRGPMDTVYDLDDHKALGLKLKIGYQSGDLKLGLGAYGYWGKYTDDSQQIVSFDPFRITRTDTEVYTESVIATDLLVKYGRFHWQSEFVAGAIRFDERPARDFAAPGLQADYNKYHLYTLFAYRLPLERWLSNFSLRPYALLEYENRDDTNAVGEGLAVTFGLNAQPYPWLTLKGETFAFYLLEEGTGHQFWGLSLQMAVSF